MENRELLKVIVRDIKTTVYLIDQGKIKDIDELKNNLERLVNYIEDKERGFENIGDIKSDSFHCYKIEDIKDNKFLIYVKNIEGGNFSPLGWYTKQMIEKHFSW